MKRFIQTLVFGIFFAVTASPVLATEVPVQTCPTGTFFNLCNVALTPSKFIQTVISLLLLGAVLIALVFLIFGGIKWILSGGDKTAVEGARNTIVGAIIGLAIALASFFILTLVATVFKIDIFNLSLPSFF